VQGDPWQQGGALVFDGDSALVFEQRDVGVGDLLDLEALFVAVAGLGE